MSDRYAAPGDVPERQIDPDPEVAESWRRDHREWPGLPRAGGGEIVTFPEVASTIVDDYRQRQLDAQKQAFDDAFDSGFRCGTEVHRCKLRDAREARDAKAAARSFHLQIALLVAIIVVVMCVTVLLRAG